MQCTATTGTITEVIDDDDWITFAIFLAFSYQTSLPEDGWSVWTVLLVPPHPFFEKCNLLFPF